VVLPDVPGVRRKGGRSLAVAALFVPGAFVDCRFSIDDCRLKDGLGSVSRARWWPRRIRFLNSWFCSGRRGVAQTCLPRSAAFCRDSRRNSWFGVREALWSAAMELAKLPLLKGQFAGRALANRSGASKFVGPNVLVATTNSLFEFVVGFADQKPTARKSARRGHLRHRGLLRAEIWLLYARICDSRLDQGNLAKSQGAFEAARTRSRFERRVGLSPRHAAGEE